MTTRRPGRRTRVGVGSGARYVGALALLAVGLDHIEQFYVDSYRAIPTIGTLFALNFAAATVVALALMVPPQQVAARWDKRVAALLALSGIGIAAGSLAGLLVSESNGLFGFKEIGYRAPIVVSIVLEVAAALALTMFVVAMYRSAGDRPRAP